MTDSPIADNYDQYRLFDGEVVEIVHRPRIGVHPLSLETQDGERFDGWYEDLTRPTRLHLQCAGDPDSPGGLLEEVNTGDFIGREDGVSRIGHSVTEAYLAEELATPAELREAGIEPPEVDGEGNEQQEESLRPPHLPVIEIERLLFNLWEWMLQTDMHIHADDQESLEQALYYVSEYLHKTGQKSYLRKCDLVELWQSFDPGGHPSWLEGDAEGEVADDTQPPPTDTRDTDTRTCPRCPGTSFTIIETVSRQRPATLDTTGRMHCGELEGEEVVDRRLRCDACQYEWRREGWEVVG